jgi:hypothetical protein
MEYKTIIIEGEEFLLIPKSKEEKLNKKYKIKFDKIYTETHFDVEVWGWSKKFINNSDKSEDCWVTFRRTEKENGEFFWTDWSTGGVGAKKEIALLLEGWYHNYMNQR